MGTEPALCPILIEKGRDALRKESVSQITRIFLRYGTFKDYTGRTCVHHLIHSPTNKTLSSTLQAGLQVLPVE
jgi:uncharacterized protein YjlB